MGVAILGLHVGISSIDVIVMLPSVFGVPQIPISFTDNHLYLRPCQHPVFFGKQRSTAGSEQAIIETRLVDLTKIIVALLKSG
jgi:hypothetical protein